MKIRSLFLALLLAASAAFGLVNRPPFDPFSGVRSGPDPSYRYVVIDSLIGTSWARVTADTGFTQIITGDTTVRFEYAQDSRYDSIRSGNAGAATITGVWALASTTDSSANANFFRDVGGGAVTFKSAAGVFANGASPRYNSRLLRRADTDFRMATGGAVAGTGWTHVIWAKGLSAGNPGVGTHQIAWSVYTSPDIVQLGFNQLGRPFFRASDDGRATWDSVGVATDYYDSTFHRFEIGVRTRFFYLKVDRTARVTTAFSNASTPLNTDTLEVFSFRNAQRFRGHVDEAWFIEDTTGVDTSMALYSWLYGRQASASSGRDSTIVRGVGLARDCTWVAFADTVWPQSTATSGTEYKIYERAWADSTEPLPIIVYRAGTTVRGAMLDSIAAGKIHYPRAVIAAAKNEVLEFEGVSAGVHDPSVADVVEFDVRVYPDHNRAQGAGGSHYYSMGRRVVDSADLPTEVQVAGPFSVVGPAVVEGWAKAAAGSSYGWMEFRFKRRRIN